jgi:hypothetical protein
MPDFSGLTDQELSDRYARADLRVRQMTEPSRLMDDLDNLMEEIRQEQARRRKEASYGERCTD